jgi:hypothetical protein
MRTNGTFLSLASPWISSRGSRLDGRPQITALPTLGARFVKTFRICKQKTKKENQHMAISDFMAISSSPHHNRVERPNQAQSILRHKKPIEQKQKNKTNANANFTRRIGFAESCCCIQQNFAHFHTLQMHSQMQRRVSSFGLHIDIVPQPDQYVQTLKVTMRTLKISRSFSISPHMHIASHHCSVNGEFGITICKIRSLFQHQPSHNFFFFFQPYRTTPR